MISFLFFSLCVNVTSMQWLWWHALLRSLTKVARIHAWSQTENTHITTHLTQLLVCAQAGPWYCMTWETAHIWKLSNTNTLLNRFKGHLCISVFCYLLQHTWICRRRTSWTFITGRSNAHWTARTPPLKEFQLGHCFLEESSSNPPTPLICLIAFSTLAAFFAVPLYTLVRTWYSFYFLALALCFIVLL